MPRVRNTLVGLLLASLAACSVTACSAGPSLGSAGPSLGSAGPSLGSAGPELTAYLTACAPRYSDEARMLGREFDGPGYHSRVPAGTWVHPTLDSLDYALALLERGTDADVTRATGILHAVIDLQQTDRTQAYHGIWPWLRQEPVAQMAPPDKNWADFCGARLAQVLIDHRGVLHRQLASRIKLSLLHAARAIQRRDVNSGYTNIAIMGAGVALTAGELLGDYELIDYGRGKLRAVLQRTGPEQNFEEYNSPTYTTVVLLECERALHIVRDPTARSLVERLRRIAWRTIAESFHPATGQWAGPHSRAYADRLYEWQLGVLAERLGHPFDTPPLRVHPAAARTREHAFDPTPALPCPAELRPRFFALPARRVEIRRTFATDLEVPRRNRIGTTWFSGDACLGSVNDSCLWAQRRAVLGYWRTAADPAVVLRLRALHDGRDFAALGVHSVQAGPRVLSLFYLRSDRGDWHHHLDRPEASVYRARDLRVRWELRGAEVSVHALGDGRFELRAGDYRARIHTRPGRFFGTSVEWRSGTGDRHAYVDAILHAGDERSFAFTTGDAIRLATAVEVLAPGGRGEPSELSVQGPSAGSVTASWGGLRGGTPTLVGGSR